jgi:hypothetical protein
MKTDELKKLVEAATPGPWKADKYSVNAATVDDYGNSRETITQGGCGCCNSDIDGVWRKEDARLIAAAPDLAREVIALREAAEAAAKVGEKTVDSMCEGFCDDLPTRDIFNALMDMDCGVCRLRAALANLRAVLGENE